MKEQSKKGTKEKRKNRTKEQRNKGTKEQKNKGTKKHKVHPIGSGITRSPGLVFKEIFKTLHILEDIKIEEHGGPTFSLLNNLFFQPFKIMFNKKY